MNREQKLDLKARKAIERQTIFEVRKALTNHYDYFKDFMPVEVKENFRRLLKTAPIFVAMLRPIQKRRKSG